MKHKFKPSVGGNRGEKSGAATGGGGRSERQASGAHALNQQHKQAGKYKYVHFDVTDSL